MFGKKAKRSAAMMALLLQDQWFSLELSRVSGASHGRINVLLTQLEAKRWVESGWKRVQPDRPRRRWFAVTPTGRAGIRQELGL